MRLGTKLRTTMSDPYETIEELPSTAGEFAEEHTTVWGRYADLGAACSEAGPLDDETKRLVKLALVVGSESEGAVHSHVRRGLEEENISPDALKHVAILAIPTLGFPQAMAALSWIEDLTSPEE